MAGTQITIDGRAIGIAEPPYIVAEVSANHRGNIEQAFEIMAAAKQAGADAIKIQTYTADTITIDHDGPGFTIEGGLWHGRTLYELYQEAYTPWEWHADLFAKARELDITIFSSPFDLTAVDFLEQLDAPAYKVASFEIIDLPLIEHMAATGKPLIMSTGMASAGEIAEAVAAARGAGCSEIALLHCTSGYPTPPEDSNLAALGELSQHNVVTGLSDHTLGIAVPIGAVALGAAIIEKHVTMRRADGGLDSAFSLESEELAEMTKACATAWRAIGRRDYARAPSEVGNVVLRRSLYVVVDIRAGELLTAENVRSIRPGHRLPPKHLPAVLGRSAARDLARGTPLDWPDLSD